MESPWGPLAIDTFISKLENNQLRAPIRQFTVYKRHVDDKLCGR